MPRLSVLSHLPMLIGAFAVVGCATARQGLETPPLPLDRGDMVFVADGAGDYRLASKNLREAVTEAHLAVQIETFVWSHGYRRIVADQVDEENIRVGGSRLAELVRARRQACPDCPISLVGHSAGSKIVLAAAEQLPPGSVQSIILLAPSVLADYDLRPALRATTEGIDVHCSDQDRWTLGFCVGVLSACQGKLCEPAGLHGFHAQGTTPEDRALYARLHYYPWKPELLATTGHCGDHYGCYQHRYLQKFVLPKLTHQQQEMGRTASAAE